MFASKKDRLDYEFLPAAIEVEETPPRPMGRWLIWLIVLLFTAAIIWSYLSKVDEVATARGKFIPDGHTKVVQPLEGGIINAIRVEEGQHVEKGEVLIELDTIALEADIDSLQKERFLSDVQQGMLEAELNGEAYAGSAEGASTEQQLSSEEIMNMQTRLRQARENEYASNLEAAELLVSQRAQTVELEEAALTGLEQNYELDSLESFESANNPEESAVTDSMALLQADNKLRQSEQEMDQQKQKIAQAEDALAEAKANKQALIEQRDRAVLDQMVANEKDRYRLDSELAKAEKKAQEQQLLSPVAGTVHGISSYTVGGVATAAQAVISVVPDDTPLIVEATVSNQDIGFIREGQEANVKVDTFPFQKYGYLSGKVVFVSPDAFDDEKVGPVFKAKVELSSNTTNRGQQIKLTPGMSVTVEAKTGKRRVIDFFLSPIKKMADESFKLR